MERSEMIDWLKRAIFERRDLITKKTEKGSLAAITQAEHQKDVDIMRAMLTTLERKASKKYKVVHDSVTAHGCCFSHTVIDTTIDKDLYLENVVCECLNEAHAKTVCDALNHYNS